MMKQSSQRRREILYNRTRQPQQVCLTMKTLLIDWSEWQAKLQALQVQLLITAISTQIFSENTTILLALH